MENTRTTPSNVDNIRRHPSKQAGRPPVIVLTFQVNLMQLHGQLKDLLNGISLFRSARNGTRDVTKGMADFSAIRSHFESNNLKYFLFYSNSQKPLKAVIRDPSASTLVEDISVGLMNLGFDVVSVKQMSTTR
jgi:hypothetical protein